MQKYKSEAGTVKASRITSVNNAKVYTECGREIPWDSFNCKVGGYCQKGDYVIEQPRGKLVVTTAKEFEANFIKIKSRSKTVD